MSRTIGDHGYQVLLSSHELFQLKYLVHEQRDDAGKKGKAASGRRSSHGKAQSTTGEEEGTALCRSNCFWSLSAFLSNSLNGFSMHTWHFQIGSIYFPWL